MRWHVGSIEVRIHPLLPLYMLLMSASGGGKLCLMAFSSVLLHEIGHMCAARLLKLQILSLDVMPMGGVVHICGLYRLNPLRFAAVALAGPMTSLALAAISLAYPRYFSVQFAAVNISLFLMNMLPALPMDGGRLLAALLRKHFGIRRSMRLMSAFGQFLGAAMLTAALWAALAMQRLILPLCLLGIYVMACAAMENDSCELSPAEEISRLMNMNRMLYPQPVQIICPECSVMPDKLISMFRPDRCTMLNWQGTGEWEMDLQWLNRISALDTRPSDVIR